MFEQAFRNIDDVLRKEAGCTTELDYTEQTSWLLFLKYLDGLEQDRALEAQLEGRIHIPSWKMTSPGRSGTCQRKKTARSTTMPRSPAMTCASLSAAGSFPTSPASNRRPPGRTRWNTRSGKSLARSTTRSAAATTCATSSTPSTGCASAPRARSMNSARCMRKRSSAWAMPGATAASITPRARSSAP